MRKTILAIVAAALALSSLSVAAVGEPKVEFSERPEKSPDGRFSSQCAGIAVKSKRVCDVSFYQLLANPERFHGQLVRIVGFLVEFDGGLVLYPNSESYENGADIDGVQLYGIVLKDEVLKSRADGQGLKGATATGYFDAHFIGPGIWRLGALHGVEHVSVMPIDPKTGVPIPPPPGGQ